MEQRTIKLSDTDIAAIAALSKDTGVSPHGVLRALVRLGLETLGNEAGDALRRHVGRHMVEGGAR